MNDRLEKTSAYAGALADRYLSARQKRTNLLPLLTDEMAAKFNDSYGAHGYYSVRLTLILDLIREAWAIALDDDDRAPSLTNTWRLIEHPDLKVMLREKATRARNVRGSSSDDWSEEEKDLNFVSWKQEQSIKDGEAFDEAFSDLSLALPRLLQSPVANKIRTARDKVIAHYEMKSTTDGRKLFPLKDAGLTWNELEGFLDAIGPSVWGVVLLATWGSYDTSGYDEMHRLYADDFWARLQGKLEA